MIRRGLRIDDDDAVSPIKQERVSFDVNRKKDAFEKDMDNLLFGGGPVKRRQPKKQEPRQIKQFTLSKINVSTPQKPKIPTQKKSDSLLTQQKSVSLQKNKVANDTPTKSMELNQNQSKSTPKKKQENDSLKNSRASRHQSSVIIPKQDAQIKFLKDRQKSIIFKEVENSRPNYIRKLKNISEDFNFHQENLKKHKWIDVTRSIMCSKDHALKQINQSSKDRQFPPIKMPLGLQLQEYDVKWQKYESFVIKSTLGKYIDPNDMKKGQFSSFRFLSTLSVLAEKQENIKRLIENQSYNSANGMYFVRLFINSVWRYYTVDTFIPFLTDQPAGVISYNDMQSDMWVAIIQKAYAKAFEGYSVFSKPVPRNYYLRDLTGAPTQSFKISNPDILEIIKSAIEKKQIILAVPEPNISILGINVNCNLTVLNLNKKGGLTLRYSWPLVEQKGEIPISREGVLQFSDTQMLQYLSHLTISQVNRDYFTTTIQTRHEKGFYVAYKMLVKQKTHGYLTLSQFDERHFSEGLYSYQPARLIIHKKTEQNNCEYIKGGFSHRERNLDVQVQLTPGEYHIFAFVQWNQQIYDFYLTFYGSKSVDFVKIATSKNHNLISLGLQTYNLKNGRRSALGHIHQFINYYEETNLVIITAINTSSKEYNYTNDLQKINFNSLQLINLSNNQDDYLENFSTKELELYKQSMSQNRKWEITLDPQESFTWVISTRQNYDPNNYRSWGFR